MDHLGRRQKIEDLLADWFRREGWDVAEGIATIWVPDDDDDPMDDDGDPMGAEATLSLSGLADHLEQKIDGALT